MADTSSFNQTDYNIYNTTAAGIGGAASLGNGITQYLALQAQGTYQLRMAEINQQLANTQADMVLRAGDLAAGKIRTRGNAEVGSQRAALAAQGLDVNDFNSSGASLQNDTRDATQTDITNTQMNAWMQAYGIRANAQNDVLKAQVAKSGANFAAGQTLLNGGLGALQTGLRLPGILAGKTNVDGTPVAPSAADTLLSMPKLGDSYFGKKSGSSDDVGWMDSNPNKSGDWLSGLDNSEIA